MHEVKQIGDRQYRLVFVTKAVNPGLLINLYKCVAVDNQSVAGFVGVVTPDCAGKPTETATQVMGPLCADKSNAKDRALICFYNRRRGYNTLLAHTKGRKH